MNEDTRRQTGRTTRGLQRALEEGVLYVVPFHNMVDGYRNLVPGMENRIVTASQYVERDASRGATGALCDHMCKRLMSPDRFAQLQVAIRMTNGEFLPE